MAKITIDTEKDSAMSMKKMISLIEHFIAEKNGEQIITNATENNTATANPFSMFGDQTTESSSGSSEQNYSTPTATHNEDMFSMFSNDNPSSSPKTYSSTTKITNSTDMSAQDLLKSVDEKEETIQNFGASVTNTEDNEKKDQDFFQLMHY